LASLRFSLSRSARLTAATNVGERPVALGFEEVELVGEGAEFVGAFGFFGEGGFAFGG
jgi:hypothetical protein